MVYNDRDSQQGQLQPVRQGGEGDGLSDCNMIRIDDYRGSRNRISMRCPKCQTLNPPSAKYCQECGNRLLVCPNCGTVNLPIAKFCIECGTPLQASVSRPAPPSQDGQVTEPMPSVDHTHTAVSPQRAVLASTRGPAGAAEVAVEQLLPEEERRIVTIMFADITGSTRLADHLDPEEMRAILTGYFNLMTEQIRKHGGTVEKYIGDAVMAVFGLPVAHEDDPDRAIRAALDMQTALARFNEQRQGRDPTAKRLQMRIGINTGEVVSPSNARQDGQDFLVTGDAVNVAARLQQIAAPDTILVGERTYLVTRGIFDFRSMAPLTLRGKAQPIQAYVVQGQRKRVSIIVQHPRGIEGRQTPLVGRTLELTLMHASYDRVQNERHPHLITLLGVPGIGKSRLIHEFIAREQEAVRNAPALDDDIAPLVLEGRCPPYGEGITYWPLIEILRTLLHLQEQGDDADEGSVEARFRAFVQETLIRARRSEPVDEIATPILRSIGRGLSLSTSLGEGRRDAENQERRPLGEIQRTTYGPHTSMVKQTATQWSLLRAWRVLFESLAQEQPLIAVVDDLQWADEALLDLLEYLTDKITDVPILFLCSARPDFFERRRDWGGGRRNFTTIALESLSRVESSELIDALLNTDELPEVLRTTILTRAEGNPFFVEELVRMFIDQGILVRERDQEDGTERWQFAPNNEHLLNELNTPTDYPEDALLSTAYLFPLPRVPDTIQGVLAARIDLLNPVDKLVLQHAAIIGRTFWLSALLELAGTIDVRTMQEALISLTQRDFLSETENQSRSPVEQDQVYSFKHVLIHDVVYNNIPRARRAQEHMRLAIWLEEQTIDEREAFTELLAYHYQQAYGNWSPGLALERGEAKETLTRGELRQRAIHYLTLAGDQALHSYYTLRALRAYNDAFELLQEGEPSAVDQLKMQERLGEAYAQRGALDEAWQEYRRALRLGTDGDMQLDENGLLRLYDRLAELATRWLGYFHHVPNPEESRQYIDAGLRLLEGKELSRERARFVTYQAFWYIRQLQTATYAQKAALAEQALASGHEALRMAEELNNASAISMALDALSFIYNEYHKYNEAHQLLHRRHKLEPLLTSREELYDLYYSLGWAHEEIADYASALTCFGRAWSLAQRMESPTMLLNSLVGRMRTWRQWNRWDNASEVALEVVTFIEKYPQDDKRLFWALETLATIAYRRGNQDQGDQYARQCKRLVDRQIEQAGENVSTQLMTRMHAIHLAQEDWTRAVADYKEKLQSSEPLPSPEVLSTLAELLVITNEDHDLQASTCERAVAQAEESGACKSLVIALRARGHMYLEQGRWSEAESDLRRALAESEAIDLPWECGLTLYQLGMLYRRRALSPDADKRDGRRADLSRARYHFERAQGFFELLRAQPSIERVQHVLAQEEQAPV